jgi:hypothetical protein
LVLLEDEHAPTSVQGDRPDLVVWSSIWEKRPDAQIHFELPSDGGGGTDLCWTLWVEDPVPHAALLGHMRKRLNELINGDLRYSFGQ